MDKILAGLNVGYGLLKAGMEIVSLVKNKGELTDEDLQAIIDKENAAQDEARDKLRSLLGS